MGLLDTLLEPRSHPRSPDAWFLGHGGSKTASGARVDEDSALHVTAVWAAVRILAESLAQLPLILYRRLPRGKERAADHPLFSLLHDAANREQTSFEWREMMQGHLVLRGNAYAQKVRDNGGRLRELIPLHPDRVHVERLRDLEGGRLIYKHSPDSGEPRFFGADQILHLRGLSSDGVLGLSPIQMAREAVGLAMAEEEHGARFFSNGVTTTGVLEHPAKLGPIAHENLKKDFAEKQAGLVNAHRPMILEEGMKWHELGLTQKDAEWLQGRKFQVTEIARIFRLPPHLLGDLERATFTNVEHQSQEFVTYSLIPWLKRWEQRLNMTLLSEPERREFFFEFLVDGLLRGDAQTRQAFYSSGIQNGYLSPNDVREMENRNPVEGGDAYFQQLNLVPLGTPAFGSPLPDDDTGDDDRAARLDAEERTSRAVAIRVRLQKVHRALFLDAARRIVRREVQQVRQQAKKHLAERQTPDFSAFLEQFYAEGGEFAGLIRSVMSPVVTAFSEAIHTEAAREINAETTPAALETFVGAYVGTMALRHVRSSRRQLEALVAMATPDAPPPAERIEERLAEWEEKRPDKIADREVVQSAGAVARETYTLAGVTQLKWRSIGDNCPLCRSMNGRVVSIASPFLQKGASLEAEGTAPITPTRAVKHPPLHQGCDCQLVPA